MGITEPEEVRMDAALSPVPTVRARSLKSERIVQGFFTRQGGASSGLYASLNLGRGSHDDPVAVALNHDIVTDALGARRGSLVTMHQTHSTDVAVLSHIPSERPRVDALVTRTPGIVLGVLTADCAPVHFADPEAGVIAVAHAGWRGTLSGILEATLDAMIAAGADKVRIRAAIGPTIAQASYEVSADFIGRFAHEPEAQRFFGTGRRAGHRQFDLPGYVAHRLERFGVAVEDLAIDTYSDEERFFSYRRATHRGEPDYGRLVGAIMLTG